MSNIAFMPINDYVAVCDVAREKTGTDEAIISKNLASKVEATYEAGKKAEYDAFWDVFQSNGNRVSYPYTFAHGNWNDNTFRPKYDIKPTSANYMFAYNNNEGVGTNSKYCISDLTTCLENAGVTLDTSNTTSMQHIFYLGRGFKRIPPISFERCSELNATFYGCARLQTIDKLILKTDGTNTFTKKSWDSPFAECTALKNIVIEGLIGDSINFSVSPLTAASIVSVIEHLSDTATEMTATFKQTAIDNADWTTTDYASWDELVAIKPNWIISLV